MAATNGGKDNPIEISSGDEDVDGCVLPRLSRIPVLYTLRRRLSIDTGMLKRPASLS